MPNWCHCNVLITGPAARVREFLEFAAGVGGEKPSPFDFDRFEPYPPIWRELDWAFWAWAENPAPAGPAPVHAFEKWGRSWCLKHWGTTGNARGAGYGESVERGGEVSAVVYFDTPWAEPRPVILKASELFPDLYLRLDYFEPLGDFRGTLRCKAGAVRFDECRLCQHEEYPDSED